MRIRQSFSNRLLLAGIVLTIILIGGVSAFLLISREHQTAGAAQSNAENRAQVARQLLERVAFTQVQSTATTMTGLPAVREALEQPDPSASLSLLLTNQQVLPVLDTTLTILDTKGATVWSNVSGTPAVPTISTIQAAVHRQSDPTFTGIDGVEVSGHTIAYVVISSIRDTESVPLGFVVGTESIGNELARLAPAIGYPTTFVATNSPQEMLRFTSDANTTVATASSPGDLTTAISAQMRKSTSAAGIDEIYTAPNVGDVAGSYVPLRGILAATAGYIGVEVPLAQFSGQTEIDEKTIIVIAGTAIAIVALFVWLFVDQFVRRPVERLEKGVARIASGDYSRDIPIRSQDELGELAGSVNRMRAQIATYIQHIDGSIRHLGEVSRALTTTTAGVSQLQMAVVTAASSLPTDTQSSILLWRSDDRLDVVAHVGNDIRLLPEEQRLLLDGAPLRYQTDHQSHVNGIPMYYQEQVVGAIVVETAQSPTESDIRALTALANSGAIALENTRLYEHEKETVQKLRELDILKSDFLSTAQHELRTPVMAIAGEIELANSAWPQWEDAAKLEAIHNIAQSAQQLADIVETVVGLSLMNSERGSVAHEPLDIRESIVKVADEMKQQTTRQLPNIRINVPQRIAITADRDQFERVVRALLDNAVKFTDPSGTIDIAASVADSHCTIEFRDTGRGMSPDTLPHIFDRFYQENSSRTRTFGGLGIGLALVKQIVEAHGATIAVTSEPGMGSCFTIVWPLSSMDPRDPPKPA